MNFWKHPISLVFGFLIISHLSFNASASDVTAPKSGALVDTLARLQAAIVKLKGPDLKNAEAAIQTISVSEFNMADLLADLALFEIQHKKRKDILLSLMHELAQRTHYEQLFDAEGVAKSDSKLLELKITVTEALMKEKQFERVKGQMFSLLNKSMDRAKIYRKSASELLQVPLTLNSLQWALQVSQPESVNPRVGDPSQKVGSNYPFFEAQLTKLSPKKRSGGNKEVKAGDSSPVDIILAGTTDFITDSIAKDIINDELFKIVGRDDILMKVQDILARIMLQNFVLIGSKGSGKTSIVELLAESIVTGEVEKSSVTAFLKDSIIIQTSSGRISRLAKTDKPAGQADAMEAFFHALSVVQDQIQRRIIVFIDEFHTLTPEQVEAIKPFTDSSKSQIMLIGGSTSTEFQSAFRQNGAFLSRMEPVPVRELTLDEIIYIFQNSWLKTLRRKHSHLSFTENTMKLLIKKSTLIYPDKGTLRATFAFADDIAIWIRRNQPEREQNLEIHSKDIYEFVKLKIGLPVDPTDFAGMLAYRNQLFQNISQEVFGQSRMINDVVDLWMSVLKNQSSRGSRIAMVLGRSGTGKTETGVQLAVHGLGSKERHFTIKCLDYADADDIKLSVLFGVPGGVNFSKVSSGTLMDWLDDPSRGKFAGIIQLDEWDKASVLFRTRFMELFDTGEIEGGDGKIRTLRHHLFIVTTNHGDHVIFPKDSVNWTKAEVQNRLDDVNEEDLRTLAETDLRGNPSIPGAPSLTSPPSHISDTLANRIDLFTVAGLITKDIAFDVATKSFLAIFKMYEEMAQVQIKADSSVAEAFIKIHNPMHRGARPMVRSILHYVVKALDTALAYPHQSGDSYQVSVENSSDGQPKLVVYHKGIKYLSNLPHIKNSDLEGGAFNFSRLSDPKNFTDPDSPRASSNSLSPQCQEIIKK